MFSGADFETDFEEELLPDEIAKEYIKVLYSYKDSVDIIMSKLRRMVVKYGVPSNVVLRELAKENPSEGHRIITLRQKLWMFFIGVADDPVEAEKEYIFQLKKGTHPFWDHICSDSKRTFVEPNSSEEEKRERTDATTRVMNSLYLFLDEEKVHDKLEFVQGLNTFVGVFLESGLSEPQAYACLKKLMLEFLPEYVANRGMKQAFVLTEMCLWELNPKFYLWLSDTKKAQNLELKNIIQPIILSLGSCLRPLAEVIHLWDFILAYGVTIFPLCFAALMMLMEQCFKEDPKLQFARAQEIFNWSAHSVAQKTISLLKIMCENGKKGKKNEKSEMMELFNCMIYHGRGKTNEGESVSGRAMEMWIERGGFLLDEKIKHFKLVYSED